jgi:hypothetical protein
MTDLPPDVARRAASRLAPDFGPDLPAFTERALAREGTISRRRSLDASTGIAFASLLVSVAQIGWQVYRDLKAEREKKAAAEREDRQTLQVLVRRMRLSLAEPVDLTPEQRDRLLEVVAEEILATRDLPD